MRSFSARDAISTILRSWLVILAVTAVAAVSALVYCNAQTPKYQASATVYASSGSREIPSSTYDTSKGSQERAASYAKLVYSDAVLEPARTAAGLDLSIGDMRSAVSASVVPATAVLTISATATSPDDAVRIVNAVSDSLSDAVARVEVPQGGALATTRLILMTPATANSSPVYPKTLITVVIAAVIGLIVGILIALTAELFNRRVRDGGDVEALTGSPPVAELAVARSGRGADLHSGSLDTLIATVVRERREADTQRVLVAALTERGSVQVGVVAAGLAEELVTGGAKVALLGSEDIPTDLWQRLATSLTAPRSVGAVIEQRSADADFVIIEGSALVPGTGASPVAELSALVDVFVVLVTARAAKSGDLAEVARLLAAAGADRVHYILARRTRKVPADDDEETTSSTTAEWNEEEEAVAGSSGRHTSRAGSGR
ncbi:YveK family protein [Gordonia sp. NPDC003425]